MIINNPYGVGASGYDKVERQGRCRCCRMLYSYSSPRVNPLEPAWCPSCSHHFPQDGEDETRELARLREHESRLAAYLSRVEAKAKHWHTEREAARADAQQARDSRDLWSGMVRRLRNAATDAQRRSVLADMSVGMRRFLDRQDREEADENADW